MKPIFARLPGMTQGKNTLSYLPGIGSRFHVQIMTLDSLLEPNIHLEKESHPLHCGSCRACLEACPTGALDGEGFHRERCLRNWQLGGQPVPESLRAAMGNRLIGCDTCQCCCPHNPAPQGQSHDRISLQWMLQEPKQVAASLKTQIGSNLALPNRVLTQACLLAGNSGDASLLPLLETLCGHPSPLVAEQA